MPDWTLEQYETWRRGWEWERPGRTAPSHEQFLRLVWMFGFTPEELGICGEGEGEGEGEGRAGGGVSKHR